MAFIGRAFETVVGGMGRAAFLGGVAPRMARGAFIGGIGGAVGSTRYDSPTMKAREIGEGMIYGAAAGLALSGVGRLAANRPGAWWDITRYSVRPGIGTRAAVGLAGSALRGAGRVGRLGLAAARNPTVGPPLIAGAIGAGAFGWGAYALHDMFGNSIPQRGEPYQRTNGMQHGGMASQSRPEYGFGSRWSGLSKMLGLGKRPGIAERAIISQAELGAAGVGESGLYFGRSQIGRSAQGLRMTPETPSFSKWEDVTMGPYRKERAISEFRKLEGNLGQIPTTSVRDPIMGTPMVMTSKQMRRAARQGKYGARGRGRKVEEFFGDMKSRWNLNRQRRQGQLADSTDGLVQGLSNGRHG